MKAVLGVSWVLAFAVVPLGLRAQLASSECRLSAPWAPGIRAECATVTVPENPAAPDRAAIQLFVARVPSHNPVPREDPLTIIAGGPGQSAADFYMSMRSAFEPIRRDRDLILIDQRGTGRSAPLTCPGVTTASLELAAPDTLPALMRDCLADLGADPRYYTTSVAVADLEQVRRALGVTQWNVYGISYGTRVAQHYLRHYPAQTRALILDGVVPSDAALGPEIAGHAQRALDQLLARCVAEPPCAARFAQSREQLDALMTTLSAAPITLQLPNPRTGALETQTLSLAHLTAVIRLLSYSPQTAALLPLLISEAHAGNFAPIAAQSQMIADELERVLSLPMHNAVVCTEDVPFFAPDAGALAAQTYLGTTVIDALQAVCSVWPPGVLDADARTPLQSAAPVLLLSGSADPITPPDYGVAVLANLTNARHLIGQGLGHGLAGAGCVPRLMREFLDDLAPATLDASCLDREHFNPFFLDFNGPSP